MAQAEWIWQDGKLVKFDEARVHVLTHALHYGFGVFEGIRCYPQAGGGAAIFRLQEHLVRMQQSAHICMLELPYNLSALTEACIEVIRANKFTDGCYLRPIAYMGSGTLGIGAENPVNVAIAAWKWGAYLGDEGKRLGIRTKISSFRRGNNDTLMAKGKITGQYVASVLAKREALKAGYQEAILLDAEGMVCEGSGENLFIIDNTGQNGAPVARTADKGAAILAGITRDTAMTLLGDLGVPVKEERFARDELYCASEAFFTGTAAEITPVREVDNRALGTGQAGPVTQNVQKRFADVTAGKLPQYSHWLTKA